MPKKPEGYSSVSVYLVVDGAQRVIDFLKKTFDATELRRYDMPNGSIMHAEVRIDDTVVMIADGGGAWPAGIPLVAACLRGGRGRDLPARARSRRRFGTGAGASSRDGHSRFRRSQ